VYVDSLSREEIWTCGDCKLGLYNSLLTYYSNRVEWFQDTIGNAPNWAILTYVDENFLNDWVRFMADSHTADSCIGAGFEAVRTTSTTIVLEARISWEFLRARSGICRATSGWGVVPAAPCHGCRCPMVFARRAAGVCRRSSLCWNHDQLRWRDRGVAGAEMNRILILLASAYLAVAQTPPSDADSVLVAHLLAPAQEAELSLTDSAVSAL
jgi:hypothetical protein